MNIKVQCCGLVLLGLLTIIYSRHKKLDLLTSKVFNGCFYVIFISLVMDVLSIFAIVYREKLPAFLPEFVCKTYPVTLILVSLFSVIYIASSVIFHQTNYKKFIAVYIFLALVFAVLIYALPIYMFEDTKKNLAWTDGPSTYMTYFGVLVFLIINLVQIARHKEFIYERQRRTVLIWMAIWIGSACIQGVLHNAVLIVGFACALGITVVFVQFENPELNLDRNTGLFNYTGYTRYGEQLYSENKNFYVIAVIYKSLTWQNEQDSSDNVKSQRIFDTFLEIPDATVFRIMDNEILLFFSDEKAARSTWDTFINQPKTGNLETVQGYPSFYYIEDPRCVSSHGELLELLQYVNLKKADVRPRSFHIIENSIVAQMRSERNMTHQIMEALKEDRIVVYYQPIFSIEKKSFTCAEALVRIIDRDGNLLMPGAFIPIAESNGTIIEIGKRVFEKVCHFYQDNKLEDYGMDFINVNLSIIQCGDDRLADDYLEIMKSTNIDPCRINLEITESASLQAKQVLISNMKRMIEYGITFSLDDFGTGKSNLDYFVNMPVNIIKFDREMIQSYFVSDKAKYVMDAAMNMIRDMSLEMVAEGIETEDQYKKMEEIRINFIQGYYFSRPLPEQEFLSFLRRENGIYAG